jgi:hypothetical protein
MVFCCRLNRLQLPYNSFFTVIMSIFISSLLVILLSVLQVEALPIILASSYVGIVF